MHSPSEAAAVPLTSPVTNGTFCPPAQRRFVLIAAILASALGFIDGSILAIAMPAIRVDLGASLAEAQWISNAYALTLSALILAGGAAGDRFGLRRAFVAGIALFIVASLACALAPNAVVLIAFRAVQGIGAAIMVPGSLAIIAKAYPKKERGRAIGIWAAASALTTALGPVLGGFVLSAFGDGIWRAIFAVNLPLGLISIYLLLAKIPADAPTEKRSLDLGGAALATLAFGALAYGLTSMSASGEGHMSGPSIAAGAVLLVVFIVFELRQREPMIDLSLFRVGAFAGANVATFFLYFALSANLFYLPMLLIAGWGLSTAEVGFIFLPLSASIALLSGPVGQMVGPDRAALSDRLRQPCRGFRLCRTCLAHPCRHPQFLDGNISADGGDGARHGAGRVAAVDGDHDGGRGQGYRCCLRHQQCRLAHRRPDRGGGDGLACRLGLRECTGRGVRRRAFRALANRCRRGWRRTSMRHGSPPATRRSRPSPR